MNTTATALDNGSSPTDYTATVRRASTAIVHDLDVGFYGVNTTYCPTFDPVCTTCRVQFQQTARLGSFSQVGLSGSFCVGADGCVCVGMCEVPSRRQWVEDVDVAPIMNPPMEKQSVLPFTTRRRDPRAPPGHLKPRSKQETCGFHSTTSIKGCRLPRSCQHCLQGDGCMLEGERCAEATAYSPARDYRNASISDVVLAQFPSSNTTYCPVTDPMCTQCRLSWPSSYYCVG